jgi:HlyD family secretion protein
MKRILIPVVLLVLAVGFFGARLLRPDEAPEYRFAEVTRGDVRAVVASTGTLQAVRTVQVGTQVSGEVSRIYVDFNDRVKKDQLIARIDPVLLEQAVRAAQADLDRNEAELAQAKREFARIERLHERQAATESELNTAQYRLDVAKASLESAKISVERAQRNLGYSEIRSPVDGIVLDRTVDEGQTVAASLSAPQLFLIAEDLSRMEILAAVDESDIGRIRDGQPVDFTVQAYPDSTFHGTVNQVRLNATSQENVVNYVVSILVDNPDGKLLPGMTATAEFIVEESADVLRAPNAALRFRPPEALLAEMRAKRQAEAGSGDGERPAGGDAAGREGRRRDRSAGPGSRTMLWTVDGDGKPAVVFATTGLTDGQVTEISGPEIREGMQLIASIATSAGGTAAANPFQPAGGGPRRGPPGF